MPVTFEILKDHSLVHVRTVGVLNMDEQNESFRNYAKHPDFAPGQKYLIDMREITSFDGHYVEAMKLHADMGETIPKTEASIMFVYLGNTEISLKMCRVAVQSLSAGEGIVACVAQTEAEALEILGLAAASVDALKRDGMNLAKGVPE